MGTFEKRFDMKFRILQNEIIKHENNLTLLKDNIVKNKSIN